MLLVSRTPSRSQRAVDALLGVSRRRRHLAYLAIIGGVRTLRPALWRLTAAAVVLTVATRLA